MGRFLYTMLLFPIQIQMTQKISSNGLTKDIYERRNERIMYFHTEESMASTNIQIKINEMAESEGWTPISLRTVQHVITQYFRENSPNPEDDDYQRDAFLAQLEADIDRLQDYINNREIGRMQKDPLTGEEYYHEGQPWAPFEYAPIVQILFKIRMDLLRIKGWNYSKNSPKPKSKVQKMTNPLAGHPEIAKLMHDLEVAAKRANTTEEEDK